MQIKKTVKNVKLFGSHS